MRSRNWVNSRQPEDLYWPKTANGALVGLSVTAMVVKLLPGDKLGERVAVRVLVRLQSGLIRQRPLMCTAPITPPAKFLLAHFVRLSANQEW